MCFWESAPYQVWGLDVVCVCFEFVFDRTAKYDQQNNNATRQEGLCQTKQCLSSTGNDQQSRKGSPQDGETF